MANGAKIVYVSCLLLIAITSVQRSFITLVLHLQKGWLMMFRVIIFHVITLIFSIYWFNANFD